jgi:hypothetical protein
MRAGQHRDRVELDRTQLTKHSGDAGAAVWRTEQTLRAQCKTACLVSG